MKFNKSDLYYDDYHWTTTDDDDSTEVNSPDSDELNKGEGYEILYFLNQVLSEGHPVESLHKAEKLIRIYLPGEIRSHEKVSKWLSKVWNDESYTKYLPK